MKLKSLTSNEAKTRRLSLRVTEDQFEWLEKAARSNHVTKNAFITHLFNSLMDNKSAIERVLNGQKTRNGVRRKG